MVSLPPMGVNQNPSPTQPSQVHRRTARIDPMSMAAVLFLLLLFTVSAATCDSTDGLKRIEGQVEQALGPPFGLPESLTIRDNNDRIWEFSIEPTVTFTTSHLLQHKARFEKVVVYYRETAEGLSAVRLTD